MVTLKGKEVLYMRIIATTQEFDELINSGKKVLVDFFAEWCGPCKMLGPVLEKLDPEYPDVEFVKVDVDQLPEVAQRYGIMSIPTYYAFNNGEVVQSGMGYVPANGMKAFLECLK